MELQNANLHGDVTNQLLHLASISLLADITFVIIIALALRVIYNLYFHPLSVFKGPTYLAASDLPLAFLQLQGTGHRAIKKAHEKYGNVARIGPNTLSYIETAAWNDIYGYRKGRAALPKDPAFYNEMLLSRQTITMTSDENAVPIRKALNPGFSPKSLLELEPMLQGHIKLLMSQLEKTSREQGSIDMRQWVTFSMFDVTSDFAFGEDLGCVKNGVYHDWVLFVLNHFYAAILFYQCHKFWPLNRLLAALIPPSVRNQAKSHDQASLQRVRRRMNDKTIDRPDFMSHFMRHAEKEQLSPSVVEAQATVIILAGSETTAVALISTIYEILNHRNICKKLCDEVRGALQTEQDINLRNVLSKLPYMNAVIKEALRLHTPLANGFTRIVADREGTVVCGHRLPQNTVVTINHYCINTSERNFRDPYDFVPDRWLDDPLYNNDKKDVVQPFSVGPRDCPGKRFAMNNLTLALAHLIWTFDMKLGEGTENWAVNQKVYNGWMQPPLPVVLKRRA